MLRFDRGTLLIDLPDDVARDVPGVEWDSRTSSHRAPAWRAAELVKRLDVARPPWPHEHVSIRRPELRDYQRDALSAWEVAGRRGVVVLPTGAGKTRTAIAAMSATARPTAVLCPTRALVEQWIVALRGAYGGLIGCMSDGSATVGPITILTFESAFRRMDTIGDRFALLVVDEVHHFGSGARAEALECATAPHRLGLTATPWPPGSRTDQLVGPMVFHVPLEALVGGALADFDLTTFHVTLDADERARYAREYGLFMDARDALLRAEATLDVSDVVSRLGRTEPGRRALLGLLRATRIASLPRAKRAAIARLVAQHHDEKILVFAASTDDAYTIGRDLLVPVITAETSKAEREDILEKLRSGAVRIVASARVLNEGIDVPDASVAIVAGAALGVRELKQRIGRVLRPSPGKDRAMVYELVSRRTLEERRANARRRRLDDLH